MPQIVKVIALGTSGSTPTKERQMPSFAFIYDGDVLLFDCGEGTQMQMLKYGINLSKVKAIFVSHAHGDHTIGIAGLVRSLAMTSRKEPLQIFVPKGYERVIKSLLVFDRAILNYPIIVTGVSTGTIYKTKSYTVRAFRLNHTIPDYGYVFQENPKRRFIEKKAKKSGIRNEMFSLLQKKGKIKVNGKTITLNSVTLLQNGKKIVYATDTRPAKITEIESKGADLLIHESAYTENEKKLAIERKHSTAKEAALVARHAKVKMLLLTHISARHRTDENILKEARSIFKGTVVAKDGYTITV